MADEIKQVLGFDASQGIQALRQLDAAFEGFEKRLRSATQGFTVYNQSATTTIDVLARLTAQATAASNALDRVRNSRAVPGPSGTGQGDTQAAAEAARNVSAQIANATGQVNNFGKASAGAMNGAARATNSFALSFETLTRIIGTQLIVRSLNSIRSATEEAFQGFIDFSKKISEIRTISDDSFTGLRDELRGLSDEFNSPLLDVAKAKYDILSNGFTQAGDATKVLTAALKFSKIGISDVSQAADLLATTLNAYGRSASFAESISAKLFKTVEVGRVVGSELAASFGRVAPAAKEVGASEEEILAAFSTITIGGVKASEAATQIRASLSALLKPSEAAEEALRKLGFASGEQLIQARGYQGALQALISTTDGSTSAVAKLFPNVRALNGVFRIASSGAEIYQGHLKEINAASSELANRKLSVRLDTDAERVSRDLNKIRNFFTVDIGEQLTKTASQFFQLTGGVENTTSAIRNFSTPVIASIGLLTAYATAAGIVSAANVALSTSFTAAAGTGAALRGVILGLVAALGAAAIGKTVGDALTRSIDAPLARLRAQRREIADEEKAAIDESLNLTVKSNQDKLKEVNKAVGLLRSAYFQQVDVAKEANAALIAEDRATLDKIISAREKFAQDLRRAQTQANQDIVDSRKRVAGLEGSLDDQRFNFQIRRLSDIQKANRENSRAIELANKAAGDLSGAKLPDEQAAAQSAFERAEAFARQAVSSAQTSGNIVAQVQAERTLEGILQKRIDAEKQFQANRDADSKKLAAAAAQEEARVTKLKGLSKDFLENSNLFDRRGELLPKDQIDQQVKTAKEKLAEIKDLAFGKGTKFNLDDLLSFDQLQQRLNQSLTKGEVNKLFASDDALSRLREQVQTALNNQFLIRKLAVDPSQLEGKTATEQFDTVTTQAQAQVELVNKLAEAQATLDKAQRDGTQAASNAAQALVDRISVLEAAGQALNQIGGVFKTAVPGLGFDFKFGDGLAALKAGLDETRAELGNLVTSPIDATEERVNALADRLTNLNELNNAIGGGQGFDLRRQAEAFSELRKQFEIQQQVLKVQASTPDANPEVEGARLKALEAEAIKQQEAAAAAAAQSTALQGSVSGVQALNEALGTSVSRTAAVADNLGRAAANASKVSTASPQSKALGGLIQAFAMGGVARPRYFAEGGAVGTDTVPAMLSPNEFVVNPQQTARWLPQLQALNAGLQPAFNKQSGDTTLNFGDIIVNEAQHGQKTVRELVAELKREFRRGASSRI